MARIDHSNCSHPRTPAGRAVCRRGGSTPDVVTPVVAPVRNTREIREAANAARGVERDRSRAAARVERSGRPRSTKVPIPGTPEFGDGSQASAAATCG
jgi:hypothetical protein